MMAVNTQYVIYLTNGDVIRATCTNAGDPPKFTSVSTRNGLGSWSALGHDVTIPKAGIVMFYVENN